MAKGFARKQRCCELKHKGAGTMVLICSELMELVGSYPARKRVIRLHAGQRVQVECFKTESNYKVHEAYKQAKFI